VAEGQVRCHARVRLNGQGTAFAASTPQGLTPADLQAAYNLPSASNGGGKTFAIVDAFDAPTAANDLSTYRAAYGLPPCPTTNGCFRKVNQSGNASPLPRADGGWAQEISLDLDMASATCPNCKILLVEANSNAFTDLAAAEDTAARLGASVISNSYGGSEFSLETSSTYNSHFNHPIPITVSSGDNGYGVEFPAASQYVTAVGGTSLTKSGSAFSERAWSGAGSGCSAYVAKPSWQHDSGCARRTVADVSAVADPNTGVAVYDSYKYRGAAGWMVFGGTSASAPIIAGTFALGTGTNPSKPYSNTDTGALHDVTSGSNGSCSVAYLCTAGTGFDGPTGLGTPNGVAAF